MSRSWIKLLALLPALAAPALGLWPDAARSLPGAEMGLRQRATTTTVAEDPNNARVIVKYRADSTLMKSALSAGSGSTALAKPQHAQRLATRLGLPLSDGRVLGARTQGLRGTGLSSSALAARLAAQPDVEWAVVDQRRSIQAPTLNSVVPNDPLYAGGQTSTTPVVGQWYLRAPDSTTVSAINAVGAWAVTTGSPAITVAVIDTGVRYDHPDLAGKLWPGYDFIASTSNSVDGDGRDNDATDPGDWTTASSGCTASSSSWHGTQVSGLIAAATNNGIGMAGVGRDVMVLPVRVLGQCGGWDSDIVAGMRWAAGLSNAADCTAASARSETCNPHAAQVLNMSLGSSGSCSGANVVYADAIAELTDANVVVVVAAGNSEGLAVNVPANCTGAIGVAGLRHAGTKVGYSSLGPQAAIAAPAGNCINTSGDCLYPLLTTINSGTTTAGASTYSDSSNYSVGTSFASPLVAGTVALMLSVDPTLTPAQVRSVLQSTARTFPTTGALSTTAVACHAPSSRTQDECYCTTSTCGAGMLDAAAAVAKVVPVTAVAPVATIAANAGTVAAGSSLTLDGSSSSARGSASLAGFAWAITSGSSLASLAAPTNGSTVVLQATAAGSVTVSLTVTDSLGQSTSTSTTLTVTAAPATGGTGTTTTTAASSGSGGGALGWGWLLGLGAAVWALRRTRAG